MLQKEMRNYKTNFTEVDEILFVPKRNKKRQKKSTKANVLIPLSKLCSTFHDSTCHLVCIFFFFNSLLRLSFLTSMFLICECLPFGFPLFFTLAHSFLDTILFYFIVIGSNHFSSVFLCHQSGIEHVQHSLIPMQKKEKRFVHTHTYKHFMGLSHLFTKIENWNE